MRNRLLAASALVLAIGVLAGCGSSESDGDAPKASSETTKSSSLKAGECAYTKDGEASKKADVPPAKPASVDSLTITTNRGKIVTTLTPDTAPCAVGSFASLAKQGYFDGTKCHRMVPNFVLQCGDPSATGTGGPGYSFGDELSGKEKYPAGTLAMANSGPDTNGSQFFIVIADAELPPAYTVFGKVDAAGLKLAQKIGSEGNAADGVAPAKDVVIESVS